MELINTLTLSQALKEFGRMTAQGFYLRYGNVGWEWLPTEPLLCQWIDNGEVG